MTARPRSCFDVSQDLVCVVGLIGRHTPGAGRVRSFKQRAGLSAVVSLAAGQHPPAQVAQPLDQSVNLRRQAASRAPNGLVPFFWGRPPHVGARELWCYRGRVPQDRHLGPIPKRLLATLRDLSTWRSGYTRCSSGRTLGAGRATERLPGPSREQPQRTTGYLRLSSQGPLVCQAIGTRCVPIGRHKVGFDSSVRVFDESASDHARVRSFFNWAGSRLMSPNPRMSPCSLCSPWFFQVPPN